MKVLKAKKENLDWLLSFGFDVWIFSMAWFIPNLRFYSLNNKDLKKSLPHYFATFNIRAYCNKEQEDEAPAPCPSQQ